MNSSINKTLIALLLPLKWTRVISAIASAERAAQATVGQSKMVTAISFSSANTANLTELERSDLTYN